MIDPKSQLLLQEMFRRENRSFLQYIDQADPWVGHGDRPIFDKLRQLAADERETLEAFANWLDAEKVPLPYLGAFPINFTSFNFVAIRKIIKPLIAEQSRELAALEADARLVSNEIAKHQVEALIKLNRQHLDEIMRLQG
jgi:hypothetical protein